MEFQDPTTNLVGTTDEIQIMLLMKLWHFVLSIYPIDGSTFMVSPKKEKGTRVPNLVGKKKAYGFYALFTRVPIGTSNLPMMGIHHI